MIYIEYNEIKFVKAQIRKLETFVTFCFGFKKGCTKMKERRDWQLQISLLVLPLRNAEASH